MILSWYVLLKVLHILSVVLFTGNIATAVVWTSGAFATGNPAIARFAIAQLRLTDRVFYLGGALVILISGVTNLLMHMYDAYHAPWVMWSANILVASFFVWLLFLRPLQHKLALHLNHLDDQGSLPETCLQLHRRWQRAGLVAFLLPCVAIILMVIKMN